MQYDINHQQRCNLQTIHNADNIQTLINSDIKITNM